MKKDFQKDISDTVEVIPREKKVVNGMVAVIVSPGFGGGWSTWCYDGNREQLMFDSRIVEKIEQGKKEEITDEFLQSIGIPCQYLGGLYQTKIIYVHQGLLIKIDEYDGSESLITEEDKEDFFRV